ncbi:hypothetical protein SAY86_023285 [Trapa natans]|uniref:Uncharacterized protein n=1 Tax=Trapa natans TaxID=22666 RepID=A0AAN7MAG4_TRANT|nr:hypothetical protein SAY86_023285 [Trapa natans]
MGDKTQTPDDHRNVVFGSGSDHSRVLDIYPLSGYYFGSKEAVVLRNETSAERVLRMKSNHAARGMRTSVEAILMVELFKHPHLLLLQIKNSIFKLPGGRLRPGESEIEGLQRKLSRKLSVADSSDKKEWEVILSLAILKAGVVLYTLLHDSFNISMWVIALGCGGGLTLRHHGLLTCHQMSRTQRSVHFANIFFSFLSTSRPSGRVY